MDSPITQTESTLLTEQQTLAAGENLARKRGFQTTIQEICCAFDLVGKEMDEPGVVAGGIVAEGEGKGRAMREGEASCKVDGEWSTRMWLWRDRYGDIPHSSVTYQLSTCRLPWATGGRRRGKG